MNAAEHVNLKDPYIALLIRRGEDMAARDACSCVVEGSKQVTDAAALARERFRQQALAERFTGVSVGSE